VAFDRLSALASGAASAGWATVKVAARVGIGPPLRPDRLLGVAQALRHWGMTPAAVCAANAVQDLDRPAVIDERESLGWAELDCRSSIVAAALADQGVGVGMAVGLLARNSADFVVAQIAVSKLGADLLYLNTGFAGPQLADVLDRENAVAVIADDEFEPLLEEFAPSIPRLTAWVDDGTAPPGSIAALVLAAEGSEPPELPAPGHDGRHVILTSGTTGRPKGAARRAPNPLVGAIAAVAFLDAIPYRARRTTMLAAPAFHAWGLGNLIMASLLQSTVVMTRRFDSATTLELIARHDADTLVAVPVMCERLLEVDPRVGPPSLKVVAVSGSALPPTLATRFMDRFGDVLYNLYGSTEVAFVSVAGPADLRAAPTSAGRILRGVHLRLVDSDGHDVGAGEIGRVFAGSGLSFDGYTGDDVKPRLDGLAATGDLGRLGDDGRLYLEGRADDMIITGGENVVPAEIENSLHLHPDVAEVAVVGIPDERFGQAVVAHVVLRPGGLATESDLRAHVKARLATYKVPRTVVFRDRLPRNESGKIVKSELSEPT